LEEDAAVEKEGVGSAVDLDSSGAADAERADNVVEGGGFLIDLDLAVGGGGDEVAGTAFKLEVAVGFDDVGGLMVDNVIGVDDVVLVGEDDLAGECPVVSGAGLVESFPANGDACFRLGQRMGDGQELAAGIVGDGRLLSGGRIGLRLLGSGNGGLLTGLGRGAGGG
jgi:hypothetical protein